MSIKLKGSTDGSVSLDAPSDTSPTGTDVSLTLPASAGSANQFIKNGSTAGELEHSSMVEDSSGNLGIGTASPSTALHISGTGVNDSRVTFTRSGVSGVVGVVGNDLLLAGTGTDDTDGGMQFFTGGSKRGSIASVGHVKWGSTTTELPGYNGNTEVGIGIEYDKGLFLSRSDNACLFLNNNVSGSIARFSRNGTQVGTISVSTTATAFNETSSDSRLKKNFEDWTDSVLPAFRNLNPKKFHFNTQEDSEDKVKGYIAQDLVEQFPEAYPLSQVNIDGEEAERYMFNPSGMVKYLMKALQEATLEIDTLKTKVAALEAAS